MRACSFDFGKEDAMFSLLKLKLLVVGVNKTSQ